MAKSETIKIKSDGGYTVINRSEFDSSKDEIYLADGEILVKPKGVADADPFVIEEKDFDENAYEKVKATRSNLEIISNQTPRETLSERLENATAPVLTETANAALSNKNDVAATGGGKAKK